FAGVVGPFVTRRKFGRDRYRRRDVSRRQPVALESNRGNQRRVHRGTTAQPEVVFALSDYTLETRFSGEHCRFGERFERNPQPSYAVQNYWHASDNAMPEATATLLPGAPHAGWLGRPRAPTGNSRDFAAFLIKMAPSLFDMFIDPNLL